MEKKFPRAMSEKILEVIDEVIKEKPDYIIIHAGSNDLTNNINLLNSAKKLVKKIRDTLSATKIAFSSIVLGKGRRNINESRADFNTKLRNFCKQKNIGFIDNGNINESHLAMKKLHLNRTGNSALAKNLLNYLENY